MVRGASGDADLVVLHDAFEAANADGGEIKIFVDVQQLAGAGVDVKLFDDRSARNATALGEWYGDCANINRDCFSFDTSLGLGYFSWRWVS